VVVVSECAGWFLSNSSVRPPARVEGSSAGTPVVLVADRFPELSETFVAGELLALQRAGRHVRVEAAARPVRPGRETARGLRVDYLTDDGLARRFGSVSALVARHPVGTLRDLAARRRWRRQEVPRNLRALAARIRRIASAGERHVHVHFADTAALDAMRCAALLRVPYSVSAHAYEVFRDVRNLPEKLTRSAFSTGESMYATEHLRSLVPGADAERVHFVASGVDTERFRRSAPYPGGRTVVAVGRLVEKKGFGDLVAAAARLREADAVDRVLIAGGGPLAEALAAHIVELELENVVELLGAVPHRQVRNLLERADVFAMPSVVAADGDRDSMPNVVYEALAMEIPVVATDEVGLPEAVRPEWGRLVPPADPKALAGALAELLGMPPEGRAAMGRAGREWVKAERDVDNQAARLGALIDDAGAASA
jgi:glycosyltransferase involved in cell wall biosynthesis